MIKEIKIPLYSPKWYAWRQDHIGGSNIASVLAAYNPRLAEHVWTSPIQYYLDLIGEPVQEFTGNVASNMGQYLEPVIINMYRYYDKDICDQMDMFTNWRSGVIKNKVICRHNYVVNDDHPHLSASPDGFVYEHRKGILECKNTTSMEANKYTDKVSPSFIAQCQHNLLCTGREFCDLIILIDGRWLEVLTIEPDKEWQEKIIDNSVDFMRRVLQARKFKLEYNIETYYGINHDSFTEKQKEGVYYLQQLEPELTGSDKEFEFIKTMIKPTPEYTEMAGSNEQLQLISDREKLKTEVGKYKKDLNIVETKLRNSLEGHHKAVFDDDLYFSYKPDKNGRISLYIHPKLIEMVA